MGSFYGLSHLSLNVQVAIPVAAAMTKPTQQYCSTKGQSTKPQHVLQIQICVESMNKTNSNATISRLNV